MNGGRLSGGNELLVGVLFFLQGFGLGGVIHLFGLVLDLIGFVLFLIFVLVSSVIFLRRENAVPATAYESSRIFGKPVRHQERVKPEK
jgi:hypothetical protein